jgi:Putative restriction endonuclease
MSDMAVELTPRTFTVAEYHRMVEAGILGNGERVELLDGLVVTMPPIGVAHWTRHRDVLAYLSEMLRGRAQVHGQISLPLGERSEPEPDLAILADLPYEQLNRVPEPVEIYAMIELAESSLHSDMTTKRRLYASFFIADYLVVDLAGDVLLHYSAPRDGDYLESRSLGHGDTFVLAAVPDLKLVAEAFLRSRQE